MPTFKGRIYVCFVIASATVWNSPKLEISCDRGRRNSADSAELLDGISFHIRFAEIQAHVLPLHDAVQ